jgi:release factor glutamine methyltransferase
MQTVKDLINQGGQLLKNRGINTYQIDAEVLLAHTLNIDRYRLIMNPEFGVTSAVENAYKTLLQRRSKKEPIAYILGNKEFWGLDFTVNPHVLIPRPDSETLVELTLKHIKDRNSELTILDLGTGSGCLIIALLNELPSSTGLAVDKSSLALEVALTNARQNNVKSRCNFLVSDWFSAINEQKFELIIANPPYIEVASTLDADVADYEPPSALYAGIDGLDAYRQIAESAYPYLQKDALIFVEIGINQTHAVIEIFKQNGFALVEIAKDLAGIERALAFRLPI